jgi:Family of unknown function (DUF6081)
MHHVEESIVMDAPQESEIYASFDSLLEPRPAWRIGEFPERDGSMRKLREPDAVTIVQNGRLSLGVRRFTRTHDRVQILDNAKHVLFSTRSFEVPEGGSISFTVELRAEGTGCRAGDLYDAFASLLCLDLSTGTAIDVFCRDDICAAVFASLPFPGASLPDLEPFKYWAIFDERTLPSPGSHTYGIEIAPRAGAITWMVDGDLLRRQSLPDYRLGSLVLGLGLMTEKTLGPNGSVSCHGQGLGAEWGPITVERRP